MAYERKNWNGICEKNIEFCNLFRLKDTFSSIKKKIRNKNISKA